MKIGIFTFHHAHNYGASLQAYALKSYLGGNGFDVEIIEYIPDGMKNIYALNPFIRVEGILSTVKKIAKVSRRYNQYIKFSNFIKSELECTGVVSWEQQVKECDILITGSDQVWNTTITSNDDMYFLPFDNKKIKLSYAASIGSTKNIEKLKFCLDKYVTYFQDVSVREGSSIQIVQDILKREPKLVCDPVFLKSTRQWNDFVSQVEPINEKYMLYYSLQFNEELHEETLKLAAKLNVKVYSIHPLNQSMGKGVINLRGVGPYEFVSLIQNAEYVCTNSFHALAFSIIFKKDVLHYHHKELGVRTVDLLRLMGVDKYSVDGIIENRFLNYEKLEALVEESKEFLVSNIINRRLSEIG